MNAETRSLDQNTLLWGIDLGGTKIEGVVLDSSKEREILCRKRLPTEAEKGYTHVLDQIELLVKKMEAATGEKASTLGIGSPGIIDPKTGNLKNSTNALCLNGKPLKDDVGKRLDLKVRMANDAHCFALAEARHGIVNEKYPEASVVFGAIIGTGVGGGIVVNDRLITGCHGISGEWGHNFLDDSGYECYCGIKGCVEKVISGTALERFYAEKSGRELTLKEIYKRAKQKTDTVAEQTLNRLYTFFGKAMAIIINVLDPDVIVVGGGVSNIDELFTEGKSRIQSHIFNNSFDTPILKPLLGDAAGVVGAAYLTD